MIRILNQLLVFWLTLLCHRETAPAIGIVHRLCSFLYPLAFNNEHFLSWSLRMLSDEFYTSVALESTLLPSKFNGVIKLNNGETEISAIISVSLGSELHKLETSFNKQHFGGKLSVVSPKLWAKEWNFKSELNKPVAGEYVFKIEGKKTAVCLHF